MSHSDAPPPSRLVRDLIHSLRTDPAWGIGCVTRAWVRAVHRDLSVLTALVTTHSGEVQLSQVQYHILSA